MVSKSLSKLFSRTGQSTLHAGSVVVGGLLAMTVPLLAYLLGSIVKFLIDSQMAAEEASGQPLSTRLPDIELWLSPDLSPLAKVTVLLAAILVLLIVACALLYLFYRQIQHAAVGFEIALIRQLRSHAQRLAITRTLSAQQLAMTDCLDYHLPRVRASLSRWWRTFPRHVVQLLACVVIALLIQPVLTLLTLLATGLVVLVYRLFDRGRRTTLPVVRERASQERGSLVALSLNGPLLESVHQADEIEQRFTDQLTRYRQDAVRSLTSSAWKTPTVILVGGCLACLFVFVVAVQILASQATLSVAGAFPFCVCLGGAALSAARLQRSWRDMQMVESAIDELNRFLAIPVVEIKEEELVAIVRVKEQVELDHVTLQDSQDRKLLQDVSTIFRPGQLIGVVSSQRLQAHALVELLLGFGRPVSGRLLVDGELVTNLQPGSLTRCGHWVARDGALVTGSVLENLLGSGKSVVDERVDAAVAGARLTDTVRRLPEGLATIIAADDDRLMADDGFRIGIARALLSQASVVVVDEPESQFNQPAEQESVQAIRGLVDNSRISVVLPQRLTTLRQCDCVLMLHEHSIVDSGTHADLLQRNELYRHLNYLRFNPFRSIA